MADTPLTIAIVGGGIQMMANSMKVLRQIGIEERVRATSFEPYSQPRTSRIQAISSANTWMRGGNDDTSWLYGDDAWNVPLNEPALNPAS